MTESHRDRQQAKPGQTHFSLSFACFTSFGVAADVALFSANNYMTYFGQTGVAMSTVLESALAAGLSATAAFQNVANSGYVGPADPNKPNYSAGVNTRINQVDALINCMQTNGLI